jgi:ABC-2 type transport system permease protein
MATIYRHTLSRYLWTILGWGICLALLAWYGMALYDTIVEPQTQLQFEQLVANYPPELMTFFGDMGKMFTPQGYIDTLFFSYMPIIIGIFAVMSGAALLAGDEEKGTLDLVLAHPVSRTALFFGRLAAFTTAILGILFITWLGFVLPLSKTTMDTTAWELVFPLLSLFGYLLFFGTLALALSMLLPSQQMATMTAGLVIVVSYFLTSMGRINDKIADVEKFFPMHYYQGGLALKDMNWGWFGLLVACAILFALLAWWRFERRDIRVGGEGGWRLPVLSRKPRSPSEGAEI